MQLAATSYRRTRVTSALIRVMLAIGVLALITVAVFAILDDVVPERQPVLPQVESESLPKLPYDDWNGWPVSPDSGQPSGLAVV